MKVNKLKVSLNTKPQGFQLRRWVVCLFAWFFTTMVSYCFKIKMVSAEVFSLTYRTTKHQGNKSTDNTNLLVPHHGIFLHLSKACLRMSEDVTLVWSHNLPVVED